MKIFLTINNEVVKESTRDGTDRICNCLNRLLHEVLSYAPAIILTIFFCKMQIFPLLVELPQRFISYFIIE